MAYEINAMLNRKELEALAVCPEQCTCYQCLLEEDCKKCNTRVWSNTARTALALADMLEEITDTLDTVTDIIDESGEWGNINAQTTIETLDKAKVLLKEMERVEVRLTDEQIKEIRNGGDYRVGELLDTIEALQQEINGWESRYAELDAGHSKLFEDFCGLKQESEQLHSQNTAMREALKQAREAMEQFGDYYAGKQTALTLHKCNKCGKLNLNDAPICLDCVAIDINKALAAIDKIGGKEDEK